MFRLIGALVLLAVLACTLVATVPARLLARVLPQDQVIMQGFTGTLWQGSATRALIRLPAGYLHLGTVRWSLEPLSLLSLSPRVSLRSEWGSQTFEGDLVLRGTRDVEVQSLEARVDADLLRQFAPVALAGSFSAQLQHLEIRDGLPYSAEGRVTWENGAWMSPRGRVPLGTYALDVEQAAGETLVGEVVTVSGPLQAEGGLRLDGRRYELDILVSGDNALEGQLKDALSLLAEPGPEGYRIALDGEF